MKKASQILLQIIFLLIPAICMSSATQEDYTEALRKALTSSVSRTDLLDKIRSIHEKAYANGDPIVYPKGKKFRIEIPHDFKPIKLTANTDFNGCTFSVRNTYAKVFLFEMKPNTAPQAISIDKQQLTSGMKIETKGKSPKLLIVKDNNLWTLRYDFDNQGDITNIKQECFRRDLFFVENNIIKNNPISTYDNDASAPTCQYIEIDTRQKTFSNLKLIREKSSTAVTNLIRIEYQYNILLNNINVQTYLQKDEDKRFYYDQCLYIENCANVSMSNITVRNTYSAQSIWGYAVEMNNVLDCTFDRLSITAIRGGFNTTCANNLLFKDCHLNRADIHYYGRDLTCIGCTFENTLNSFHVYNRVSSFFGTLKYEKCVFNHFIPVRIDSEYNSFTSFNVEMNDCTLNIYHQPPLTYNCICHIPILESLENTRAELRRKNLPNIKVNNLKLEGPSSLKDFYFFIVHKNKYTGNVYGMDSLQINGLTYNAGNNTSLTLNDFSLPVQTAKPYKRIITGF